MIRQLSCVGMYNLFFKKNQIEIFKYSERKKSPSWIKEKFFLYLCNN